MRDYGKVVPSFWTDGTGKRLRGDADAQIVALYLMTNRHANMIGIFFLPVIYIAHETGRGIEGASKGLARLVEEGFCEYDHESEWIWVKKMAALQVGEQLKPDDKRCAGVRRELASVSKSPFVKGFCETYRTAYHLEPAPNSTDNPKPLASPSEAPCKPVAVAVAVTVDRDTDVSLVADESGDETKPTVCPHKEIVSAYHELLPTLRRMIQWDGNRADWLRARWRENPERQNLDWWRAFFAYIEKSDFLTGRNGEWTNCDLEWIVKQSNFRKIVEGKYTNRRAA